MQTVIWKAVAYEGMEYLTLDQTESSVDVSSVVIGVENQEAFRLDYQITCDENYSVRQVSFCVFGGRGINLTSDGRGNWFDREGKSLPEFDGCIDVDISATPFTNTLPIRRINWQVGQSEVLKMVYILVPNLKVSVMRQCYTCLEKSATGARFRYENLDDDFTAELTVDGDGLVLDYPGLWEWIV